MINKQLLNILHGICPNPKCGKEVRGGRVRTYCNGKCAIEHQCVKNKVERREFCSNPECQRGKPDTNGYPTRKRLNQTGRNPRYWCSPDCRARGKRLKVKVGRGSHKPQPVFAREKHTVCTTLDLQHMTPEKFIEQVNNDRVKTVNVYRAKDLNMRKH